jgi:hypothetical protein
MTSAVGCASSSGAGDDDEGALGGGTTAGLYHSKYKLGAGSPKVCEADIIPGIDAAHFTFVSATASNAGSDCRFGRHVSLRQYRVSDGQPESGEIRFDCESNERKPACQAPFAATGGSTTVVHVNYLKAGGEPDVHYRAYDNKTGKLRFEAKAPDYFEDIVPDSDIGSEVIVWSVPAGKWRIWNVETNKMSEPIAPNGGDSHAAGEVVAFSSKRGEVVYTNDNPPSTYVANAKTGKIISKTDADGPEVSFEEGAAYFNDMHGAVRRWSWPGSSERKPVFEFRSAPEGVNNLMGALGPGIISIASRGLNILYDTARGREVWRTTSRYLDPPRAIQGGKYLVRSDMMTQDDDSTSYVEMWERTTQ